MAVVSLNRSVEIVQQKKNDWSIDFHKQNIVGHKIDGLIDVCTTGPKSVLNIDKCYY